MPFRRLRRILTEYGCVLDGPNRGKVDVTREVILPGRFRKKKAILHTQIVFGGEGRDVSKSTIKKVREDLQLDDLSGVDARAFYGKGPIQATGFIASYRKTLRRLARF